ncbi:MAG: hypothetical protein ACLQU5_16110 [Isosphaeraceae bacterium]
MRETCVYEYAPDQLDIITPRIRAMEINKYPSAAWFQKEIGSKLDRAGVGLDVDVILPSSLKSARKAAEALAYYFRREFRYDFPQYHHLERTPKKDRVLLLSHKYTVHKAALGAICFRWRDYENVPAGLALAWAWFHPYLRRQGVLTAYWPVFREVYGSFYIEPPISSAMGAFLTRMGECPRCGIQRVCKQCKVAEAC